MSLEFQATGIKSCSYFTFVINQLKFGRQHNFKPHHFSTVPRIRACRDTFFVILYTVYTGTYYSSNFFFQKILYNVKVVIIPRRTWLYLMMLLSARRKLYLSQSLQPFITTDYCLFLALRTSIMLMSHKHIARFFIFDIRMDVIDPQIHNLTYKYLDL